MERFSSVNDETEPSSSGTYVYLLQPNEINCSGIVTALQYGYMDVEQGSRQLVFSLLRFQSRNNGMFEVVNKIEIQSQSSSGDCTPIGENGIFVCSTTLQTMDQFDIEDYYSFGVSIPLTTGKLLLGFRNSFLVNHHLISATPSVGDLIQLSQDNIVERGLRALRFLISKSLLLQTFVYSLYSFRNI